jgi:hypothetical protein
MPFRREYPITDGFFFVVFIGYVFKAAIRNKFLGIDLYSSENAASAVVYLLLQGNNIVEWCTGHGFKGTHTPAFDSYRTNFDFSAKR